MHCQAFHQWNIFTYLSIPPAMALHMALAGFPVSHSNWRHARLMTLFQRSATHLRSLWSNSTSKIISCSLNARQECNQQYNLLLDLLPSLSLPIASFSSPDSSHSWTASQIYSIYPTTHNKCLPGLLCVFLTVWPMLEFIIISYSSALCSDSSVPSFSTSSWGPNV